MLRSMRSKQPGDRKLLASACLALVTTIVGWPDMAGATPVTFGFSGRVTSANFGPDDQPYPNPITILSGFSGNYTFDSGAADLDPASSVGRYAMAGPPFGLTIDIGGNPFVTANRLLIEVDDIPSLDAYLLGAGLSLLRLVVGIFLKDPTGGALASDALPPTPPPLAAFATRTLDFQNDVLDRGLVHITGRIDSLTCLTGCTNTPLPEPPVLILAGIGLLAMKFSRRRQSQFRARLTDDDKETLMFSGGLRSDPPARRHPMHKIIPCLAFLMTLAVLPATAAPVLSTGTPATSVPTALYDPLNSLAAGLPPGQFLLPIEITGATNLQDWGFDLSFDENVANPLDRGGLYQSVYQAVFNGTDPVLSNITSSGFDLGSMLAGITGFSSGVSGDGTLAYVLFAYEPGQETNDPNLDIGNPTVTQTVPEPVSLALLAGGLMALFGARRREAAGNDRPDPGSEWG